MKLSEAAKKYADAVYFKSFHQVALDNESGPKEIRASATSSDPKINRLITHYFESTIRLISARVDSYVDAYKKDGAILVDDEKEILEEIKKIIKNSLLLVTNIFTVPELWRNGKLLSDMESYLEAKFERLLGEAALDLNLAKNVMVMENKSQRKHIIPNIQNVFNAPVSSVQTGNQNTANVTQNIGAEVIDITALLKELRQHIVDNTPEQQQEGLELLEGLEAEAQSSNQSKSRIKLYLKEVGSFVKDTGKDILVSIGTELLKDQMGLPK